MKNLIEVTITVKLEAHISYRSKDMTAYGNPKKHAKKALFITMEIEPLREVEAETGTRSTMSRTIASECIYADEEVGYCVEMARNLRATAAGFGIDYPLNEIVEFATLHFRNFRDTNAIAKAKGGVK